MSELLEKQRPVTENHHRRIVEEDDIIDVSCLDFDDKEAWLYVPRQHARESTVHDLRTWLRSEPELGINFDSPGRKYVDTRTFTRPKKRPSRTSFDSIFEATPAISNMGKSQLEEMIGQREDSIPSMLKPLPSAVSNLLAEESGSSAGPESMEVFLNMSIGKGVSDPLMNVSQPSIFYSSITSLPRDDSLCNTDNEAEEKLNDITASLDQQMSQLEQMQNVKDINETFAKLSTNVVSNELNETYNAEAIDTTVTFGSDKNRASVTLSSTFTSKSVENKDKSLNNEKNPTPLDATYLQAEPETGNALNATYSSTEAQRNDKNPPVDNQKLDRFRCANSTPKVETPVASRNMFLLDQKLDSTFKFNVPLGNQSTPKTPEVLNSTYKTVTKHLDQSRIYNPALHTTFKAPTSLRRELLAEIQRTEGRKLDSTYNHVPSEPIASENEKIEALDTVCDQNIRNDVPIENKYNTYKKDSSLDRTREIKTDQIEQAPVEKEPQQDRKFYTFTKKVTAQIAKSREENPEPEEDADSTFIKPHPKLQKRKTHVPRMLSKLPQFLQKSNPNLVSNSLKMVSTAANPSSIGYMKGSQPNIVRDVEKSLANKMYALGKIKSGSEQRLPELNTTVTNFQMSATGGSTESIESTQSAHSAPDLDDRLSTCSDSSHNSYSAQPMNIEQLHKIMRMQQESLKEDCSPKMNKRVLENTWVEAKKDLPSPITKNGIDGYGSDSSSPISIDSVLKTSSPLLSPTGSSQSINADGHQIDALKQLNDQAMAKKLEVPYKPVARLENRTRLRQPTNFNASVRPTNAMSGIPRPPSRIPALRFTRPVLKNPQLDPRRA